MHGLQKPPLVVPCYVSPKQKSEHAHNMNLEAAVGRPSVPLASVSDATDSRYSLDMSSG